MAPVRKKCSYKGCSSDRKYDSSIRFFHFPQKLTSEWITASGNDSLWALPRSTVREYRFICEKHFEMTDYRRIVPPFKNSTGLRRGVIPKQYVESSQCNEDLGSSDDESNLDMEISPPASPTESEDLGQRMTEEKENSSKTEIIMPQGESLPTSKELKPKVMSTPLQTLKVSLYNSSETLCRTSATTPMKAGVEAPVKTSTRLLVSNITATNYESQSPVKCPMCTSTRTSLMPTVRGYVKPPVAIPVIPPVKNPDIPSVTIPVTSRVASSCMPSLRTPVTPAVRTQIKAPARQPFILPARTSIRAPVRIPNNNQAIPIIGMVNTPVSTQTPTFLLIPPVNSGLAPVSCSTSTFSAMSNRASVPTTVAASISAPIPVAAVIKAPVPTTVAALIRSPVPITVAALIRSLAPPTVAASIRAPVPIPVAAVVRAPVPTTVAALSKAPVPTSVDALSRAPVPIPVAAVVRAPAPTTVAALIRAPVTSVVIPISTPVTNYITTSIRAPVMTSVTTPIETPVTTSVPTPVRTEVPIAAVAPIKISVTTSETTSINAPLSTVAETPIRISFTTSNARTTREAINITSANAPNDAEKKTVSFSIRCSVCNTCEVWACPACRAKGCDSLPRSANSQSSAPGPLSSVAPEGPIQSEVDSANKLIKCTVKLERLENFDCAPSDVCFSGDSSKRASSLLVNDLYAKINVLEQQLQALTEAAASKDFSGSPEDVSGKTSGTIVSTLATPYASSDGVMEMRAFIKRERDPEMTNELDPNECLDYLKESANKLKDNIKAIQHHFESIQQIIEENDSIYKKKCLNRRLSRTTFQYHFPPAKTSEELDRIAQHPKMIQHLLEIKERTITKTVIQMMTSLMSKELARKFSWTGSSRRRNFSFTRTAAFRAIEQAVLSSPNCHLLLRRLIIRATKYALENSFDWNSSHPKSVKRKRAKQQTTDQPRPNSGIFGSLLEDTLEKKAEPTEDDGLMTVDLFGAELIS